MSLMIPNVLAHAVDGPLLWAVWPPSSMLGWATLIVVAAGFLAILYYVLESSGAWAKIPASVKYIGGIVLLVVFALLALRLIAWAAWG
jgi:hypothetical protein